MSLTEKDLDHVLNLAHIELEPTRKHALLPELQSILKNIEKLNELNLDNIPPKFAVHNEQPTKLREDVARNATDLRMEQNAPDFEAYCFVVPQILDK